MLIPSAAKDRGIAPKCLVGRGFIRNESHPLRHIRSRQRALRSLMHGCRPEADRLDSAEHGREAAHGTGSTSPRHLEIGFAAHEQSAAERFIPVALVNSHRFASEDGFIQHPRRSRPSRHRRQGRGGWLRAAQRRLAPEHVTESRELPIGKYPCMRQAYVRLIGQTPARTFMRARAVRIGVPSAALNRRIRLMTPASIGQACAPS
jgi:hypothetical protein